MERNYVTVTLCIEGVFTAYELQFRSVQFVLLYVSFSPNACSDIFFFKHRRQKAEATYMPVQEAQLSPRDRAMRRVS